MIVQRIHIIILSLILFSGMVQAGVISVSSASVINNSTWHAGDTLRMTGTTWIDQTIKIKGNGTATNPIVLQVANVGSITLTGESTLTIDGSYIVVDGLLFSGDYKGNSAIVTFSKSSHHCRLTNTEIREYNLSDSTKDTKWVSINGQDNRVDHCAFSGKSNSGTLLVVWLVNGTEARHRIDHNHFGYRNSNLDSDGKEMNGQEIIRVGDSSTSMTQAKCVVDSNYFYHCNGEIETISNKSCGNIYRANTFYECKGMLTLRHGNDCLVENNYFIGNDVTSTGGVRIIGENHVVRSNSMVGLTGTNWRAAICVARGKNNSELNEYYPVKNVQISDNVIVNCKQAFCLNYHSSSDFSVVATGTSIYDNQIWLDASRKNYTLIYVAKAMGGGIVLSNNVANINGNYTNLTPSAEQIWIDGSMTKPTIIPIATEQNTGIVNTPSVTSLDVITTSTPNINKQLVNGIIQINMYYEKTDFTNPIGTTIHYGIDGRCIGVRKNY